MNAQDASDAHGVEPTVVDQSPDRLWMNAELRRDFSNAYQPGLSAYRRHNSCEALQVSVRHAWADRLKCVSNWTY
jgi:hypothetical protein